MRKLKPTPMGWIVAILAAIGSFCLVYGAFLHAIGVI